MEKMELYHKISALLLAITGVMHLIAPFVLGFNFNTTGMVIFGVIYLLTGILLFLKDEHKLIALLSIIFPLVGAIAGTAILILSFSYYLLFMVILDPIIIFLRILVYKDL